MPPPPPQPAELSVDVLSTLDLDFLNFAGLSALALMIVYFIFTCYERKYWNRNGDIEGGRPPSSGTVAEPLASEAGDSSSRRRASTAVISTKLFQYGEGGLMGKNADCSICLDEFSEGEICRMLPKCKHVFHRFCIDQWLPNERHCPVCRSPVHVRIVYSNPS
ncbi:E3 ubiquitin-protein ligase RING1-like [Benincasa hispida]|uniref:E3 ubiquitin-protein ligase RING1-like n=1 Tax=Benincasa hispida TaxID=102211 RepID=UPI0019004ABB|nr:E3 ubiquitin-protein ligase RING1-like [Benincasa hispida]